MACTVTDAYKIYQKTFSIRVEIECIKHVFVDIFFLKLFLNLLHLFFYMDTKVVKLINALPDLILLDGAFSPLFNVLCTMQF